MRMKTKIFIVVAASLLIAAGYFLNRTPDRTQALSTEVALPTEENEESVNSSQPPEEPIAPRFEPQAIMNDPIQIESLKSELQLFRSKPEVPMLANNGAYLTPEEFDAQLAAIESSKAKLLPSVKLNSQALQDLRIQHTKVFQDTTFSVRTENLSDFTEQLEFISNPSAQ